MNISWLHNICSEDHKLTLHPHTLTLGEEKWTIATNGHILVALHAAAEGLEEFPLEHPQKWLQPRAEYEPINFAGLRDWINPHKPKPCPYCGGSGHLSDVEMDEGSPEEYPEDQELAILCGFPLDLWLLREPFKHVEAAMVRVSHLNDNPIDDKGGAQWAERSGRIDIPYPLLIDGGEWRIVIKGYRAEKSEMDKLPKFP